MEHGRTFNKLTSVFYASVLLLIMNFVITLSKGRTIRKVMGGRGIFRLQEFFFLLTTCARIFFLGETLCTIFFSNKYYFFLSEILIHYLILCFINYSTLVTDHAGHFLTMCGRFFRKCTERRE